MTYFKPLKNLLFHEYWVLKIRVSVYYYGIYFEVGWNAVKCWFKDYFFLFILQFFSFSRELTIFFSEQKIKKKSRPNSIKYRLFDVVCFILSTRYCYKTACSVYYRGSLLWLVMRMMMFDKDLKIGCLKSEFLLFCSFIRSNTHLMHSKLDSIGFAEG